MPSPTTITSGAQLSWRDRLPKLVPATITKVQIKFPMVHTKNLVVQLTVMFPL
jgi:hypothetical protein